MHSIDDCYQLTRTFGGFSAQCLSKLLLKEFTVLLLTTISSKAFQVDVILIWYKCWATDIIEIFYNKFCSIVSCSVIKVIIEDPSCTGSSEPIQVFKHLN